MSKERDVCILVRWIMSDMICHWLSFLFLLQIPGWTATGELWTQDRQEHVHLLIQLALIDPTTLLLWDQWSWLTLLSAESSHQLVWWSLFVSSALGCQTLTSNTASKHLTAVWSSYSPTCHAVTGWETKTLEGKDKIVSKLFTENFNFWTRL